MMRRSPKITPSIPIKPLLCLVPGSFKKDDVLHAMIGWAYLHPRSLTIVSRQEMLGSIMDRVPEKIRNLFRPFILDWPYREKIRIHYPFIRGYQTGEEGTCERRIYEGIRSLASAHDFRMSCSQYAHACHHVTRCATSKDSTLIRHLNKLDHKLQKTDIARARAIAFIYYEQRYIWNPLKRSLDVQLPSKKV